MALRAVFVPLLATGCVVSGSDAALRRAWWYDVSAGFQTTCGLAGSGYVECWGELDAAVPQVEMTQMDAGYRHGCGISYGEVLCWGDERPSLLATPTGDFRQVSTLARNACAIDTDNALTCWGDEGDVLDAPDGEYQAVVLGEDFACAIGADEDLACWGEAEAGEASPPSGNFGEVDAGSDHACAIRSDDSALVCWGAGDYAALDGEYQDLAVGWDYTCGLDWSGAVTCLFGDGSPFDAAPEKTFVRIDGGYRHVCGVADDGTAHCWGLDEQGEADVPHNPEADD